jgi:hypothetical protein
MLPKKDCSEDVLWTLDDCDDADLGPESKRALGLDGLEDGTRARDLAPRPILLQSGEVPAMTEEAARELLQGGKIRAA